MNLSYSSDAFEAAYTYAGSDLGASWSPNATIFRLWAPSAQSVALCLYRSGTEGTDDLLLSQTMVSDIRGTWITRVTGDLHGVYYTYRVTVDGKTIEACDPYAHSTGVNGRRAMVLDLSRTNPNGWAQDVRPHLDRPTDAVIYEVHIRDLSSDPSSGISHKGLFLGAAETGTNLCGLFPTGLDHIKSLGITHVQLMPVYDFGSVDESHSNRKQYNWGYDPANFNVPEGSYSTNPFDGRSRVAEMKQMVKAFHDNGIGVIMDVVYNHVFHAEDFCFNRIVPGYFSRPGSNGSGCGNDTASERSMVRKYIVDSVNYWADEYHIDGFRFDLVGLIDTETIREIMETVHQKHPECLFYGEGWHMGTKVTKANISLATQGSGHLLPGFGFFNDTLRDALRGSVFRTDLPGYVTGDYSSKSAVEKCFLGAVDWADDPVQSINYISCHDNNTLFDRIALAMPHASRQELIRRNKLAAAICLLSQGIPMMLSGEELLRTKPGKNGGFESNSYRSPDSVNSIKWNCLKEPEYQDVFCYYRGLIAFRRTFPVLRLATVFEVKSSVFPIPTEKDHLLAFALYGSSYRLIIAFNAGTASEGLPLPEGSWDVLINDREAGILPLESCQERVTLPPVSVCALMQYK